MRTLSRCLLIASLAVATIFVSSGPAHAQVRGMHARPFQMPSVYSSSTLGAELMLGKIDVPFGDDFTLVALELFGSYEMSPRTYLYGRLPLAWADSTSTGSSLGNLTAGLEHRLSSERKGDQVSTWSVGGSLSLPSASDSGDSGAAAFLHGFFRLPYPGHYLPNVTTVRVHGQYRLDAQKVFFQAQGGINHLIVDGGSDTMLVRIGLAVGVAASSDVSLIAEITTISDILDDSDGENFLNSLDLGARFRAGTHTQVGVRLYVPLDDRYQDQDVIGLAADIVKRF